MQNIKGKNLKQLIEEILNKIVSKYNIRAPLYFPYLTNLQNNPNLALFIDDLYNNMDDLRLIRQNILSLIIGLGTNSQVKKQLGYNYYSLWLEFRLIDQFSINNRISAQQIQQFMTSIEKQSIKSLQEICLTHGSINSEKEIKEKLGILRKDELFQQMTQFKTITLESKLKKCKSCYEPKSVLLHLNPVQQSNFFFSILERIVKKIPFTCAEFELQQKMDDLKELMNEILQKFGLERDILKNHLSEAIFNILGIQVRKNNCVVQQQTNDVIKQRFYNFRKFFFFQKTLSQYDRKQIKIEEIFNTMKDLLEDGMKNLWYWPTYDKKSFVVFIIQKSFYEQKISKFIQILNSYLPNMTARIFNINRREFLQQILTQTPKQISIAQIIKCIEGYSIDQNINFQRQHKNGATYETLLRARNVPKQKMSKWYKPASVSAEDYFYIYCCKTKIKQILYISVEDRDRLLDKWKDLKFHQSLQFSGKGYSLDCTLTDKSAVGTYKSERSNHRSNNKSNVQYSGILNYGNLESFQNLIKQFQWVILSEKWEEIRFDAKQNNEMNKFIKENHQNYKSKFKIKLKTGILVEINTQTMVVNQLGNQQSQSKVDSMMKRRYGYLAYLPAHKKKNTSPDLSDQDDEMSNSLLSFQNSQKEQSIFDEQKIHTLDEKFQFLGVFRAFFHINNNFTIDQKNQNLFASNTMSVDYFKNWLQTELNYLMEIHLAENENNQKQNVKNSFKLPKKYYIQVKQQLIIYNQKIAKKIKFDYIEKEQHLIILNLKRQKHSREFYQALIKYITLKINKQSQQNGYFVEVEHEERIFLQSQKQLKIQNVENSIVKVTCTKQEKQQLLKQVAALNQIHQFNYQDSAAFKLMKQNDEEYLKQISLNESYVGQDSFRVTMKLKDHPNFKEKLLFYHNKIQREDIQQKIESEAQFLHLYRSQFQKQDLQINVSKMGNDLLMQYKEKMKKKVNKVLSKIHKQKQKYLFTIAKNKSRQYVFNNVQRTFIYIFKEKLVSILKQTSQMQLDPNIDVKLNQNTYILTALHVSPEQEKIVQIEIKHFCNRCKQFILQKKQILNTSKIYNEILNQIPNNKIKSTVIERMRIDFKKYLAQSLNEIIAQITQIVIKNAQRQFQNFIKNQKSDSVFISRQKAFLQRGIYDQISKINVFQTYLLKFLEQKEKQQKRHLNRQILKKQMAQIIEQMHSKFKFNEKIQQKQIYNDKGIQKDINIKDLQNYFKSLHIFYKIYYGQQLPITEHLNKFKQLIFKNDVVLVKVGTGSGKSTVIPPYLIGLGYQKIIVTQPRRFPCHQIYKRVSDVFGCGICGYEVADGGEDKNNGLIYMTDGLLKMRALHALKQLDKIDVLIIDEIHERSANIDMLLLLLNLYYKENNRKLKLVLCSATIDKNIIKILDDVKLKTATFQVSVQRYPVAQYPIKNGNIYNRILELAAKLDGDQQMLVFFPSIKDVNEMLNLLKNEHNHRAYPLMAQQNPIAQARFLEIGQIFIATSIAETSLTFKNLRFVVDSQMSRWRKFNPMVQLLQTQEDFSSNSSIAQRKGRLGRTCPGQYHYFVYPSHDLRANKEHNTTELENNDLTSYIYELLLRQNASLKEIQLLIKKLNHEPEEFDRKFKYSLNILKDLDVIDSKNVLTQRGVTMKSYGNLGNPQHNYALYQASKNNCMIDMVYLVSFLMMGINRSGEILKDLKSQTKGGDLRTIHYFIADIVQRINLDHVNNHKQIIEKMKLNCKNISDKPWFSVIVRVMMKVKELGKKFLDKVITSKWQVIVDILCDSYKNKIFFNQSVFGGNKANYQKFRKQPFCFEQKEIVSNETIYKIDLNSLASKKDGPPLIIISLNCGISPQNQCILSICEEIKINDVKKQINIQISFCQYQFQTKYFKDSQPMNEKELFEKLQSGITKKYNFVNIESKFPVMRLNGNVSSLSRAFSDYIEKQRRNSQVKIDIKTILEQVINKRLKRVQRDNMQTVISKQYSLSLLKKLTKYDMKKLFQTMKFQMLNNHGVQIEWDVSMSQTLLIVKNSKNIHLNKIITKLTNFCRWFADSQTIWKQQLKIKPQFIEDTPDLARDVRASIMERINQIVDSKIDQRIIKDLANCSGSSTRYLRTGRMIATCWVLVNKFDCIIKGGFVRDWIVNNDQVLPITNLRGLLKKNPRNNYIEVDDEKVTPSDIDAELSDSKLFEKDRFIKQMKKIGIPVIIEEDGWRKHVIFDKDAETGGFTADLIEPYTSMCHDTFDFDVNILYIQKEHLNAIGQKIPLQYLDKYGNKIKVSLEKLLSQCRKKQMCTLKQNIFDFRLDKFTARGWKINRSEVHQPLIYKDYMTKSSPIDPNSIQNVCSVFHQKIVVELKCKILRIQSLANKTWDDAFDSISHWIVSDIEKKKDQEKKSINSNNKILFYSSRNSQETADIKQYGFDSRFFNSWGYNWKGTYFLDDPKEIDKIQTLNKQKTNCKDMFVVLVALGTQQKITFSNGQRNNPGKGCHSLFTNDKKYTQYIVERWGQAKPIYLIQYKNTG